MREYLWDLSISTSERIARNLLAIWTTNLLGISIYINHAIESRTRAKVTLMVYWELIQLNWIHDTCEGPM
jgi:hypothetical protein